MNTKIIVGEWQKVCNWMSLIRCVRITYWMHPNMSLIGLGAPIICIKKQKFSYL
jgi:hypothetical protein